jgi:hypothetical protein
MIVAKIRIKMIKKSPIFLVFLFLLASHSALNASETKEHDAGMWTYTSVSPKPIGQWQLLFAVEHRSKENFRETFLWCGDINVYYKVNKYLKFCAGYEFYLNKEDDGSYSSEHRYYPEANVTYGLGQFTANIRTRVMNTFTQWNDPCWETRNRFKLCYFIKGTPLKPFVYTEPYHTLHNFQFQKIRYAGGCTYAMSHHQLDFYYMREVYQLKPFFRHVIALDYTYSF